MNLMTLNKKKRVFRLLVFGIVFGALFVIWLGINGYSSNRIPTEFEVLEHLPQLEPDYTDIAIPFNIAPLNFRIEEKGDLYWTKLSSENGLELSMFGSLVQIPISSWKRILEQNKGKNLKIDIYVKREGRWYRFRTIENRIIDESVDPWISYRIIPPGYEHYCEVTLRQRNMETFQEETFYRANLVNEKNCVNCHSFQNGQTNNFLFHSRNIQEGTIFVREGKAVKVDTKTKESDTSCTYPCWHPTLPLVAFSVNNTRQIFHSVSPNRIEVLDFFSDLVLYDVDQRMITPIIPFSDDSFKTFPHWAPDGKTLYYSSAQLKLQHSRKEMELRRQEIDQYINFKYNIMKISFDPKQRKFGKPEMVLDASAINKSAVFPRLSPDGRYLVYTLSSYGTFPIWHRDSDLWILDLQTGASRSLEELNSKESESYHTWSSSGRWLIFSSRRKDSLYTRFYISHFDSAGHFTKPFLLPQKDPRHNQDLMRSYNIPEFMKEPVHLSASELAKIVNGPVEMSNFKRDTEQ